MSKGGRSKEGYFYSGIIPNWSNIEYIAYDIINLLNMTDKRIRM